MKTQIIFLRQNAAVWSNKEQVVVNQLVQCLHVACKHGRSKRLFCNLDFRLFTVHWEVEMVVGPQSCSKKLYRPRIRHAASKRPKPTIQDHVATGSGIFAKPKWATRATRQRTREIIHTIIVGALPELRITFPLVDLYEEP